MLTAECPWCAILIKEVPDEQDGQTMDCPRCSKPFKVAGRQSTSKGKKGGTSAQTKSLKAQPYPSRKEFDAARAAEKAAQAEEERAEREAAPVKKPVRVRVSEPEEDEEEASSGSGIPWFVVLGILAFLLGSVGLTLASFSGLEIYAVGLTFLGLALGAIGFLVAYKQDTGTLYPLLGVVVCLPALLWSAYCYAQAPKPDKGKTAADLGKKTIVSLDRRSGEGPTAAQEGELVDYTKQAQQQGDLRVAVISVSIAKPTFADPPKDKKQPSDKCLIVQVRLSNVGVQKKYDYSGWGQWGSDTAATLRDTKAGKVLKLKRFEAAFEIKGQVRSTAVLPGKSVDDYLVFEAPPAKDIPARLRLELPAAAINGDGNFLFEIGGKSINIMP